MFPFNLTSIVLAIASALLFLIYNVIYNIYFHPLKDVPGPFFAKVSDFHLLGTFLRGNQHEEQMQFHEKYGPIVRVGTNLVIVNDPAYFQAYCNWDKSLFWRIFLPHPTQFTHANAPNMEIHNAYKKLIMPAYQMSVVIKHEPKIDKHISMLTTRLRERCGKVIDFAPWAQWAAFDIVMDVVFSNPPGFLEQAKDVKGLIENIHSYFTAAIFPAIFTSLSRITHDPRIYPYIAPKTTDPTGPGLMQGLAYWQAKNRLRDLQDSTSKFSDVLQDIIDKSSDKTLPPGFLEQESVAPIFAGSDTVSGHVRAAVLYITTTPRVLAKLRKEIDDADSEGLLSDKPTFDEIRKHLPYVELVHKEAMRMFPVIGSYFPRQVPKDGTTIHGHFLPAGTDVGFNHWAVSRNPKVWGDDVNVFRPERWENPTEATEADQRRRRLRDSGNVFFLSGPTMCTGRYVAQMEIYKLITQLFREFDIQIFDPTRPWKAVNNLAMMQEEFWTIFTERERAGRKKEDLVGMS